MALLCTIAKAAVTCVVIATPIDRARRGPGAPSDEILLQLAMPGAEQAAGEVDR